MLRNASCERSDTMPPKMKFTHEEVIAAALEIVREGGMPALTARSLAAALGSSAKPVFGLFENMQQVIKTVCFICYFNINLFFYKLHKVCFIFNF